MNCEFGEKVSMLIDGELSAAEEINVRRHLENCPECRELEKDLLFFRERIREAALDDFEKQIYELPVFESEKPFWKRGIMLPVPAFAGLLMVFACLIFWGVYVYLKTPPENLSAGKITPVRPENPPAGASLARFDQGGRAEIYIISTATEVKK